MISNLFAFFKTLLGYTQAKSSGIDTGTIAFCDEDRSIHTHDTDFYCGTQKLGTAAYQAAEDFSAASHTHASITTSAGSASLPVYFSGGKPAACAPASVFSALSNSGTAIAITVAGQSRALTVGYATTAGTAYNLPYGKSITGNKNNYKYHRILTCPVVTNSYDDRTGVFMVSACNNGGSFGIFRVSQRTNDASSATSLSTLELHWLYRHNIDKESIQAGFNNTPGGTYADIFYICKSWYGSVNITCLNMGSRGTISNSSWSFVNSSEVSNTTDTDKLTSYEVYTSIEDAGNALGRTYTKIITEGIQTGEVKTAEIAAACTGNSATATKWATARTLTIGNTGKSVNGSANVSWSLAEIGAAAASHAHPYLSLEGGTVTGDTLFNGTLVVGDGISCDGSLYVAGTATFDGAATFKSTATFSSPVTFRSVVTANGTITANNGIMLAAGTRLYSADDYLFLGTGCNAGYVVISDDMVGNTNPTNVGSNWCIEVGGDAFFSSVSQSSDQRLKENIHDVDTDFTEKYWNTPSGLIHEYNWKKSGRHATGMIAQELLGYIPEAVNHKEEEDTYTVDYTSATCKILGAMFKKIKQLEAALQSLETKNSDLEAALQSLETKNSEI